MASANASGAFEGHGDAIAAWIDGVWRFFAPAPGWRAYVVAERMLVVYGADGWEPLKSDAVTATDRLGINTAADANNRLAVRSSSVLLTHEGASQRLFLNKRSAADTASLVFQTNFSGRGEFGATGDDNLHLKVSVDGAVWTEALSVNAATGVVSFTKPPAGAAVAVDGSTPFTGAITTAVAPLVNDATSMTLYRATVPGVINSAGGDDTQDFSIGVASGRWSQGPTGQKNTPIRCSASAGTSTPRGRRKTRRSRRRRFASKPSSHRAGRPTSSGPSITCRTSSSAARSGAT